MPVLTYRGHQSGSSASPEVAGIQNRKSARQATRRIERRRIEVDDEEFEVETKNLR